MSLNSREKRLALGFGAVILIAGLSIGTSRVRAWKLKLQDWKDQVEQREIEAEELRKGAAMWTSRLEWLDESLPQFDNDGEARSTLVSDVQQSAGKRAITLQSQKLIDADDGRSSAAPAAPEAPANAAKPAGFALQVAATGELKDLVQWWQDLLGPERFRHIEFLKLTTEDDTSSELSCEFQIWQSYRLRSEDSDSAPAS